MRTIFIDNLKSGQTVDDVWAVAKCDERTDKNDCVFLCFEFADRTGTVSGFYNRPRCGEYQAACDMEFARVRGVKNEYGLRLSGFPQAVPVPDDLSLFLPTSPVPLPELTRRFDALMEQVREPQLAALLRKIFAPGTWAREQFWEMPAATRNHHAYRHGLLEHSVEVAEYCAALWDTAPPRAVHPFQRDLLLTGALLHDIGKIRELVGDNKTAGGFRYSTAGSLLGHTTLGLMTVRIALDKLVAPTLRDLLLHLIASHHGKCEWGAPVPPTTRESLILSKADALSAELFHADEARRKAMQGERGEEIWPAPLLPAKHIFVGDYGFAVLQAETVSAESVWRLVCPWRDGEFAAVSNPQNQFATVRLPLLARVAAGPGIYAEADVNGHFPVYAWAKDVTELTHYLLVVQGDSMTQTGIADNDLLVVLPARHADHGDIIVATLLDGAVTVKRLDTSGKRGPTLHAESRESLYPSPFVPAGTTFCIEGVVQGVLRPA